MELQYRVRIYQNPGELESALQDEAQKGWELKHAFPYGPNSILAVFTSGAALKKSSEIAPWDHAAQAAKEANLAHEFTDPREED